MKKKKILHLNDINSTRLLYNEWHTKCKGKVTFNDCKHVNLILWRCQLKDRSNNCNPNSGAFVMKFSRTLFFY